MKRILSGAWWPAGTRTDLPPFPNPPARDVRADTDGQQLAWSSPKLARDVQCESQLEAAVYELFDASEDVEWYCEQPLAIPYIWRGSARRYFPDSLVRLTDGRHLLVEIKPHDLLAEAQNLAKWDAARDWCAARGVGFLVCNERKGAAEYLEGEGSETLERLVISALATEASIDWATYTAFRDLARSTALNLVVLAHRRGLEIHRAPWALRRRSIALG